MTIFQVGCVRAQITVTGVPNARVHPATRKTPRPSDPGRPEEAAERSRQSLCGGDTRAAFGCGYRAVLFHAFTAAHVPHEVLEVGAAEGVRTFHEIDASRPTALVAMHYLCA